MKATTFVSAVSTLLLAPAAMARSVVLGHHGPNGLGGNFNAAWISGTNPCTDQLQIFGTNDHPPCGIHFSLGGFPDLHFEECGNEPIQVWQGNNFISNSEFRPQDVGCGFDPNGYQGFQGRYLFHLNDDLVSDPSGLVQQQ